jgi:hypothetical protein
MPCEIEWKPNGVVKHLTGTVSAVQLLRAIVDTQGDPRFDGLRYVVADCLDCVDFIFNPREVQEMAALGKAGAVSNPHIRIAVVATLPAAVEAATQYASSPLNAFPTRIFGCREDAEQWIHA